MILPDLKVGDDIEYLNRLGKKRYKRKTGKIIQITPKHITIQGAKYPDTILINNLNTGEIVITEVNGKKVTKTRIDEKEILAKAMKLSDEGLTILEIADQLKVQSGWLGLKLDKALTERAMQEYKEQRKEKGSGVWGQVKSNQKQEGEEIMQKMQKIIDWETVWPQVEELRSQGKNLKRISEELGISYRTLYSKVYRENRHKQVQAEPVQAEEIPVIPDMPCPELEKDKEPTRKSADEIAENSIAAPVNLELLDELRDVLYLERHKIAELEKALKTLTEKVERTETVNSFDQQA